jgi:hypothetical protein
VGVVVLLLISCVLTQGIPDQLFRTSLTYTPQQGPPNPALLDSRPERVALRYVADYLKLAGTFPCVQDLSQYLKHRDPVLAGQPCHISRPVASYAATSVTIRTTGLFGGPPEAVVILVVHYTDGEQWTDTYFGMRPDHYGTLPFIFYFHLDCWASYDTLQMFGRLVPDIPPGASYEPRGGPYLCKNHAGHTVPTLDRHETAPLAGLGSQGAAIVRPPRSVEHA